MERLQRMFHAHGMGPEPGQDNPTADNSEMVYISSLSLLKVKPNYRIDSYNRYLRWKTPTASRSNRN
ncbi:hypothetical protein BGX31_002718 [Mortierella sp. GBA43]|nr:hypothetical protein BGX31_002718 [Mortierella sp. GBA43]